MPATLDRPPSTTTPELIDIDALPPRRPRRGFIERYQQHLWIGAVSVAIIAVALSPFAMGYLGRQPVIGAPTAPRNAAVVPANLSTSVSMTASEFKFSPTSIQVPAGPEGHVLAQQHWRGGARRDRPGAGFTLLARAGQTGHAASSRSTSRRVRLRLLHSRATRTRA